MTDKVQKIREEVERLMYGFNLEADIASCEDAETEKFADIKYQLCKKILDYIDKAQEEPVSEDLEEAAIQFATDTVTGKVDVVKQGSFFWGAQWKERQFEKNRLKHCDSITNEQAELEQGFIDQHIDKHQRMPTFLDAIEYGMRLQKEKMMANTADAMIGLPYENKDTETCKSCKRRYDDAHLSFPDCWDGHKEENKRRGTGCKYYVFDENIL